MPNPHVQLQAIDQLGAAVSRRRISPPPTWRRSSTRSSTAPRTWHAPAHAIVSLARMQPDAARTALPRFVQHPTWQVRMYAARAAGVLGVDRRSRTRWPTIRTTTFAKRRSSR